MCMLILVLVCVDYFCIPIIGTIFKSKIFGCNAQPFSGIGILCYSQKFIVENLRLTEASAGTQWMMKRGSLGFGVIVAAV